MKSLALFTTALSAPSLATAATADFFAAALCEPPYSTAVATGLYEEAESFGKADTSSLGAAIYRLPEPVARDGLKTEEVVFAGMSIGVLIDGASAAQVARRFDLIPEKSSLFGASSKGFARVLPDDLQSMKDAGLISIIAREGPALGGKTLLACEFVSNEDRQALEAYEESESRP